jgi:hypothetical protein
MFFPQGCSYVLMLVVMTYNLGEFDRHAPRQKSASIVWCLLISGLVVTVLLGSFSGHLMLSAYDAVKLVCVLFAMPLPELNFSLYIVQFGSFRSQNEQELPGVAIVHPREATGTGTNTAIGGEDKGEGLPRETGSCR